MNEGDCWERRSGDACRREAYELSALARVAYQAGRMAEARMWGRLADQERIAARELDRGEVRAVEDGRQPVVRVRG